MRAMKDENADHRIEWGYVIIGWALMVIVIIVSSLMNN